jgi:hypothetical protein
MMNLNNNNSSGIGNGPLMNLELRTNNNFLNI